MAFDKNGTLVINAYSASGALPIKDTHVRVVGAGEENRTIQYSVVTDLDGVTLPIILPAPPRELSQSPGANQASYAIYDIIVTSPGYYTKRIYNVAVFDGEKTIQRVNMIPLPMHENNVTYPRDNLNTLVRENEMLE